MKEPERPPKEFDCIASKKSAQAAIFEKTRRMSIAELREFYRRAAEEGSLGEKWKRIPLAPLYPAKRESS